MILTGFEMKEAKYDLWISQSADVEKHAAGVPDLKG